MLFKKYKNDDDLELCKTYNFIFNMLKLRNSIYVDTFMNHLVCVRIYS